VVDVACRSGHLCLPLVACIPNAQSKAASLKEPSHQVPGPPESLMKRGVVTIVLQTEYLGTLMSGVPRGVFKRFPRANPEVLQDTIDTNTDMAGAQHPSLCHPLKSRSGLVRAWLTCNYAGPLNAVRFVLAFLTEGPCLSLALSVVVD